MRGLPIVALFALAAAFGHGREISVPRAYEITDQEKYPYCALYAMSTFVELWDKAYRTEKLPGVDSAFLAMAHNAEISSGMQGHDTFHVLYTVARWGAIPKGATTLTDQAAWPLADWREAHKTLIPMETLRPILSESYVVPDVSGRFTGKQYLKEKLNFDPSRFAVYKSSHTEERRASTEESEPVHYRLGTEADADAAVKRRAEAIGLRNDGTTEDPDLLYTLLVANLYQKRPALLSLYTSLTVERFWKYVVIGKSDLVAEGQGKNSSHIAAVVAHCHRTDSVQPVCKLFNAAMKQRNVADCVVLQNSWGGESHSAGYVCLSRRALQRMMKAVVLPKSLFSAP